MHDDLSPRIYIGDKRELEKKLSLAFHVLLLCKLQLYFPPMNAKRDKISLLIVIKLQQQRGQQQQLCARADEMNHALLCFYI